MNGEKKNGEVWILFTTARPWCLDKKPANLDLVWLPVNAFVKTTKSRLHFNWQGENCCARMRFLRFKGIYDSEWVLING